MLLDSLILLSKIFWYYSFRLVVSNGQDFSRPFRHIRIESPPGYGLAERICIVANKKEKTWCSALEEFYSQIKYSRISSP